jgi:hypothetical protein
MGSTTDFVAATVADALLPAMRRPLEDVILETLDQRQVPTRSDFKEMRDLVNTLRGQLTGATTGVKKLADRTEAVEDALTAAESRIERAERDADARFAAALAPLLARIAALEAGATSASAPNKVSADAATKTPAKADAKAAAPSKPAPAASATAPASATGDSTDGCKVPDCDDPVRSKGFCARHYQKWRRGTLDGFPLMG